MNKLTSLLFFYKKLIVPSLIIASGLGGLNAVFSGSFSFQTVGLAYMFLVPLFHFFTYEVKRPNEYYFYYNLGFTKRFLWCFTVVVSSTLALILMSI